MTEEADKKVECVGSLLVHQSDMKELAEASDKKAGECVGSLLVHAEDVQELSSTATTTEETKPAGPSLVRRITEKVSETMNRPLTEEEQKEMEEDWSAYMDGSS